METTWKTTEQVLRALDLFQGCAAGGGDFAPALLALCDAFAAECATLEMTDRRTGRLQTFAEARLDPASTAAYTEHYWALSPRVAYGMTPSAKPVASDRDILSEAEMDRDPFYAEFLAGYGLRYFLSIAVDPHPDVFAVVALQFAPRHGFVEPDKLRLAAAARPLLGRGMREHWLRGAQGDRGRIARDMAARFGLTPAEARLALALLAGASVSEHAGQAGISRNTAYTHYARLKAKLGCRRQAALVARLHRLYPMHGGLEGATGVSAVLAGPG